MVATDLSGKNALVCGGSQGIGLAAARELAARGAAVTVLSRSEPPAEHRFRFLRADLQQIEGLIANLESQLGAPPAFHVIVNNSGGPPPGAIVDATVEQFLAAFRQQLLASHLLMQWVLPAMKAAKYGRFINVISTSLREPIPGLGVSNTIRGAMAAWAKRPCAKCPTQRPTRPKPVAGTPRRDSSRSQASISAVAPMPIRAMCAGAGSEGMEVSRSC